MRNRNLVRAGVRPDLIVLGAAPDHEQRRQELLERGLLVDGIGMLNIYEHYREHGWGAREPLERELPDLAPHRIREEEDAAGTPWRVTYRAPGDRYAIYDYLRTDGTPYLRIPAFGLAGGSRGRGEVLQIDPQGRIVREYKAAGQWFRLWIRELAKGQERTFVFVDSRHVVPHVVPIRARTVHAVYVMHNLHVLKPYRWDSEVNVAYTRVLRRVGDMDALVTLTERQRDDIAERRGRTSNMFVVPNPVDLPALPDRAAAARSAPRDDHGAAGAAEAAAGRDRGVRAGRAAVPEARLDIFGEGSRREQLQQEIDRPARRQRHAARLRPRGARGAVDVERVPALERVRGLSAVDAGEHEPRLPGRELRHQVRPARADHRRRRRLPRPARRRRRAGRPPDRAAPLTRARRADERRAREAAARKGPDAFVQDWARVLGRVVERRRHRTRIDDAALEATQLRTVRGGRLRFAGVLRVRARRGGRQLESAAVTLAAIDDASGAVAELPLKVEGEDGTLKLQTPTGLLGGPAVPDGTRLRLRLTWQNSAWETELGPERTPPA